MKKLLIIALLLTTFQSNAQLLFPESFVLILDSTKRFKGNVLPSVEIKKQKRKYTEINNAIDFAYKFRHYSLSLANKLELTKDGSTILLSGGYLYAKLKTLNDHHLVPEYYMQYQWADARGLDQKYALGANLRYKIYKKPYGGFFFGLGAFYEYELWDNRGVPDERLLFANPNQITNRFSKVNTYLSFRQIIFKKVTLVSAFYYQNKIDDIFNNPRLAGDFSAKYRITEHVSFSGNYRWIYDYQPVVPIDNYWYNFFSSIEFTF